MSIRLWEVLIVFTVHHPPTSHPLSTFNLRKLRPLSAITLHSILIFWWE